MAARSAARACAARAILSTVSVAPAATARSSARFLPAAVFSLQLQPDLSTTGCSYSRGLSAGGCSCKPWRRRHLPAAPVAARPFSRARMAARVIRGVRRAGPRFRRAGVRSCGSGGSAAAAAAAPPQLARSAASRRLCSPSACLAAACSACRLAIPAEALLIAGEKEWLWSASSRSRATASASVRCSSVWMLNESSGPGDVVGWGLWENVTAHLQRDFLGVLGVQPEAGGDAA